MARLTKTDLYWYIKDSMVFTKRRDFKPEEKVFNPTLSHIELDEKRQVNVVFEDGAKVFLADFIRLSDVNYALIERIVRGFANIL